MEIVICEFQIDTIIKNFSSKSSKWKSWDFLKKLVAFFLNSI